MLPPHPVRRRAAALAALLLAACTARHPAPAQPGRPAADAPALPQLGRGVNFGNVLEASPREGDWGPRLSDELFDRAREAGAATVRLPVRFSNYAAVRPPYALGDSILDRVAYAVSAARARGMNLVIDMHHYRQLGGEALDRGEPRVDPALVEDRFVAIWTQVAERFRGADPAHVAFELYNEPNGTLTPARWNPLLRRALAAVRRTNPARWVVVGPTSWNNADALAALDLPDDPRLIVTIHNYEPFRFTHQGAGWVTGADAWLGTTCCSPAQLAELTRPLDVARRWNARGRPLWVGEIGSYERAPMASRVAYARAARDSAEARGFAWAYWEFAAGFGIWDPATRTWRAELRDALFGGR